MMYVFFYLLTCLYEGWFLRRVKAILQLGRAHMLTENILRLLLNLKSLQTWKITELQDFFFCPSLSLFSVDFGALRQDADKTT